MSFFNTVCILDVFRSAVPSEHESYDLNWEMEVERKKEGKKGRKTGRQAERETREKV